MITVCAVTARAVACKDFEPKIVTVGDTMRAKSNEDLADMFAAHFTCYDCPLRGTACIGDGETERTFNHCYDMLLAWLNSPAENEEDEDK
jgi:hypothetical protein